MKSLLKSILFGFILVFTTISIAPPAVYADDISSEDDDEGEYEIV